MRTELRIKGPNCPFCLNDTLAALRASPGVGLAEASSTSGCLIIDHDDLDPAVLIETVRSHLHGVTMASSEIVMDSIEPLVIELHCDHAPTIED